MAGKSVIKILIDGDAKGLTTALDKSDNKVAAFAGRAVKSFAVMGAVVAGAGVAIGKSLITAGETASTSNARIKQITESMELFGDEADVVSQRLIRLAEKTALNTGVDQNAIKMTQAKLLTFAGLAKTADTVGGAFDRATLAAVDMASAGFGTAEGNAVQLGKAMQDPIKGVTALAKSGVTFTAQEREKIKTLVESGNLLGAQEMILAAVEKQVGGTAAATANASDKMRVAFSQLQERLGQKLLPVFEKVSAFVIEKIIPAFERLARRWAPVLGEAFGTIADVAQTVGEKIGQWLQPAIERIGQWISDNEGTVKVFFGVVIGAVAVGAVVALAAAFTALLSPAVLITAAVAAIAAAVYYAYTEWEFFRTTVDTVAAFLTDTVWPVLQEVFGWMRDNIPPIIQGVSDTIAGFVDRVQALWARWGDTIMAGVSRYWGYIQRTVGNAIRIVQGVIQTVLAIISGDWSKAWEGIKKVLAGVWDQLKAIVGLALDAIGAALSAAWDGFVGVISGLGSRISRAASGMFDGIKNAFRSAVNFIIDGWNGLEFRIPGFKVGPVGFDGFTLGTPNIPRLAKGGIVTEPTLALIGEAGPEAVVPLSRGGGYGMSAVPMVVNITTGADPNAVIQAIKRYERSNGPGWRS